MRRFHGGRRAALAHRAKRSDVAEHLGQRHLRLDDSGSAGAGLLALDDTELHLDSRHDIRLAKVIALEEKRLAGHFRQRVGETISKI